MPMAKQNTTTEEQKKRELGGRLWLAYYNQTLYEKGLITERERNKMALKINGWNAPSL